METANEVNIENNEGKLVESEKFGQELIIWSEMEIWSELVAF